MGFGHCHQRVRSVARSSGDAIAKRTFNSCIFTMLRCLRIMIDYWASGACLRKELSIPAPGLLSTGAISDPYDRAEDRRPLPRAWVGKRSEEHTSELQSRLHLVCRLLLAKKKKSQRDR